MVGLMLEVKTQTPPPYEAQQTRDVTLLWGCCWRRHPLPSLSEPHSQGLVTPSLPPEPYPQETLPHGLFTCTVFHPFNVAPFNSPFFCFTLCQC